MPCRFARQVRWEETSTTKKNFGFYSGAWSAYPVLNYNNIQMLCWNNGMFNRKMILLSDFYVSFRQKIIDYGHICAMVRFRLKHERPDKLMTVLNTEYFFNFWDIDFIKSNLNYSNLFESSRHILKIFRIYLITL